MKLISTRADPVLLGNKTKTSLTANGNGILTGANRGERRSRGLNREKRETWGKGKVGETRTCDFNRRWEGIDTDFTGSWRRAGFLQKGHEERNKITTGGYYRVALLEP